MVYISKSAFLLTLALAGAIVAANLVPADAETCDDSNCDPTLECKEIPWTCDASSTTPAPLLDQTQYNCCKYLGTCGKNEQINGSVYFRHQTFTTNEGSSSSKWLDMYVGGDVQSRKHAGAWNTYVKEASDKLIELLMDSITDSCLIWPEWYNIALASVEDKLNITAFTVLPAQPQVCSLSSVSSTCDNATKRCKVMTKPLPGAANPTPPEKVTERHCNKFIDDEISEVNASSIFSFGLAATGNSNLSNPLELLTGWTPQYGDAQPWVKIIFYGETYVTGIMTQGLIQDIERHVDSFTVMYEDSTGHKHSVGNTQLFYAGGRLNTEVTNYFPEPILAVSITIYVKKPADAKKVGMRFRLLGCKQCTSNDDCDNAEGRCLETGECSYTDETFVSSEVFDVAKNLLDENNATDAEKESLTLLLGYGEEGANVSSIDPKSVSIGVTVAVIGALSQIGSESGLEETAVAIEKIVELSVVLGKEDTAAVNNLDTPAKIEAATNMVTGMATLVNTLFEPENIAAWDIMAANLVPNSGSSTTGSGETGTNVTGDSVTEKSDMTDAELAAAKKANKQKEDAKISAAAGMLDGIGKISTAVLTASSENEFVLKTNNVEVKAVKNTPEIFKMEGYDFKTNENLGTSISMTSSNFPKDIGEGEKVTITTVVINMDVVLAAVPKVAEKNNVNEEQERLVSNLLSFDITAGNTRYSVPISYELQHKQPQVNSNGEPIETASCVYLDEDANTVTFLNDGLVVLSSEANKTKCKSTHTTTFAVMMYLGDISELGPHPAIQDHITMACGTLSVIAVSIAVAVFIYIRDILMSERILIHLILMVTTGLGMLTFMLGTDRTENEILCKVITIVIHFLYTSMFSWMLVEGVHLYRQIITVFDSGRSSLRVYFVVGWGIPVVIVSVTAGLKWNEYGNNELCYLHGTTLWAFIGPIIPVVVINCVVLVRVIQVVVSASKLDGAGETVTCVRAGVRSSLMLLPLLGITWVFGYLMNIKHLGSTIAFSYLFTVLNSLQGFFMAVFHCFLNTEVRQALKKNMKKLKDSSLGGSSNYDSSSNHQTVLTSTLIKNKVAPAN